MRFFFILLLLVSSIVVAQPARPAQFILTNARQQPLIGATIQLTLKADSTKRMSNLTDSLGRAMVTLQLNTLYLLTATLVGMKPVRMVITPTETQTTFRFVMIADTKTLDSVTVTARKPLIRQEDDKTIVDPEAIASSSSNAFELLEKTPGLFLDQDGNVYLSSSTPATIYINGWEQKMSATDIAQLLKNLPPNSIDRIELMRTPSAKYDASGSGGAVNVVLKKGVKLGRTGSLNATANQGRFGNQSLGINLSNSNGGRSSYLNTNYSRRNNFEQTTTARQLPGNQVIGQEAYVRYPGESIYAGYGFGFEPGNRWSLNLDGRASYGLNRSLTENQTRIHQISDLGQIIAGNRNDVQNTNQTVSVVQDVSATYKLDTLGSELTANVSYNYLDNQTNQDYNTAYFTPAKPALLGDGTYQNTRNYLIAQVDYRQKLPHQITVEAGMKTAIQQFGSRTAFFIGQYENRAVDRFRTNTFDYSDGIHAGYAQASKTFGAFVLKGGVRLENTNMRGHQRVPRDTTFAVNRTDLFPYIYLSRSLVKIAGYELRSYLVYRRSIARPGYDQLNPFARFVDPYLYDTGNPALQPQFTRTFEANISVADMPILAIGRNYTQHIFTSVLYQDSINASVTYRTYDNLGSNRETYFRLLGGIPPGGTYFFVVGGQYHHNNYTGRYENQPLAFSRGSCSFFTFHQLKIDTRSTATLSGFYRLRGQQQFYELGNFGNLNLSINRQFLAKKLMVTLSLSDALYTNRNEFILNQGNIMATGSRRADTRRVGLNIRYNFGSSKRSESNNPFNFDALERNSR